MGKMLNVQWDSLKERDHSGDLGADGRIILNLIDNN